VREDNTQARNYDLSAAAEIFANGSYFLNALRTFYKLEEFFFFKDLTGKDGVFCFSSRFIFGLMLHFIV
jgi:hypothetical protein